VTAADGPAAAGAEGTGGGNRTRADDFSAPTYHSLRPDQPEPPPPRKPRGTDALRQPPAGTGNLTVTRAVLARSRYFSRLVAHKVISASEADGARESGLAALIWNQVMSYGADAMVTVALAGTVFFSAPSDAKRGNVLLYLLITMAPFAVVAPVIGPALDRLRHGRRWVMAATGIGRALLAVVMALNFTDLYVLFPAALGSLVLSKAYSVIRSAAAPRLVPTGLTLVEANARLSLFGLVAAIVGGGLVGVAIKLTGSYPFGLWITAVAFAATGYYSFRLPKIVDSLPPTEAMAAALDRAAPVPRAKGLVSRFGNWARRGFAPHVVLALQAESSLRWLSGFLTMFLAFYIEATSHGVAAVVSLAAVGAAAGIGNFAGTAVGTRLRLNQPELVVLAGTVAAAAGCLLGTLLFSRPVAIAVMLVSAVCNSLAKLSLDAVIQRDVAESLRSSGFGRSETFLQLAWVLGAAVALLLPSGDGRLGFGVAAAVLVAVSAVLVLRRRAIRSHPPLPAEG